MLLDFFTHWAVYGNVAPLGTLEALNFSLSYHWSGIQLAFCQTSWGYLLGYWEHFCLGQHHPFLTLDLITFLEQRYYLVPYWAVYSVLACTIDSACNSFCNSSCTELILWFPLSLVVSWLVLYSIIWILALNLLYSIPGDILWQSLMALVNPCTETNW